MRDERSHVVDEMTLTDPVLSYLSKPTVEGDNWMITQQVAAYLIKKTTHCIQNLSSQAEDPTDELLYSHLRNRAQHQPLTFLNPDGSINDDAIVHIFAWRAAALSYAAYEQRVIKNKPWTELMIQLHSLSHAYSFHVLVSTFHAALSSPSVTSLSSPTPSILRTCFRLFALHTLSQASASFLLTSSIRLAELEALDAKILETMAELRPHAVKLVDAWAIPDWLLDSALGRYDGRVYEDLFDRAHRKNPLNGTTFNVDWRSEEIVLGSADQARHLLAKL